MFTNKQVPVVPVVELVVAGASPAGNDVDMEEMRNFFCKCSVLHEIFAEIVDERTGLVVGCCCCCCSIDCCPTSYIDCCPTCISISMDKLHLKRPDLREVRGWALYKTL